MDNKKDIHNPEEQNKPLEIPTNELGRETNPVKSQKEASQKIKHRQRMRGIKIAYGVAISFAFIGALTAKIASEKAVEGLNVTFPSEEMTLPFSTENQSIYFNKEEEPDFEVRGNLTDVPDTRHEISSEVTEGENTTEKKTEATTEKKETSPYAVPYKDYYTLPLGKNILMDYSPDTPVYNSTMNDWRTHSGVDFKGEDGSQVLAIGYGMVSRIYDDSLYGTVIEIDHGNQVIAKYCGLNKEVLEVKKGDMVKGGTLLGYLGTIPCEKTDTGHLHFEIIYKNKKVDPLELMGK